MAQDDPSFRVMAAVISELPEIVRANRARRGVSLRQAAEEIGIAFTSLHRFEQMKKTMNQMSIVRLLVWLDRFSD